MISEIITSRQNPTVSYACKLSDKKQRDKEKSFRFDGFKLFEEAVQAGVVIDTILVSQSAVERFEKISSSDIAPNKVKILLDSVFEKISEEKSPEGIICIAKYIDKLNKCVKIDSNNASECLSMLGDRTIFAVESIRDPGNLGTIIRTASAFGVDHLIISSDCADIYNARTVRAAMGAIFRQSIVRVERMPEFLKCISNQNRHTYAATLGQDSVLLGKHTIERIDCIVVGNEGHGLSQETINTCDKKILIPMAPNSESLNAAVAASVCMWDQFGKLL